VVTFKQCAEAYIVAHRSAWKNAKHADQWASTLESYAYPAFGGKAVSDIETRDILAVLEPIWVAKGLSRNKRIGGGQKTQRKNRECGMIWELSSISCVDD
jgi:hypothetical protein